MSKEKYRRILQSLMRIYNQFSLEERFQISLKKLPRQEINNSNIC
jgi:hypothetical protein